MRAGPRHSVSRPPRDWTVLYFGGGANNLDRDIQKSWKALNGKELPDNVETYLRHVDSDGEMQDIHLDRLGRARILDVQQDVNSADPEVFTEFLKQGVREYPAKRYLVVVSSHGRGAEGVIEDDRHDELMSLPELRESLEQAKEANQGRALDAVMFDACRMSAIEMATELSGVATVAVASMDNIANVGFSLEEMLEIASESDNAHQLGQGLVENEDPQQMDACNSLAAIDLEKMEPLQQAVADLADEIQGLDPTQLERVRNTVRDCRRNLPSPLSMLGNYYLGQNLLDDAEAGQVDQAALELWLENEKPGEAVSLMSLAQGLMADELLCESAPSLKSAAQALARAHNEAVFEHRAHDEGSDPGGLTILMPLDNPEEALYQGERLRFDSTEWEQAYDTVVPVGSELSQDKSWLELALESGDVD